MKGKSYSQYVVTLPKEFGEKIEKDGIVDMLVTADDILLAIPPKYLHDADVNKIQKDSIKMLQWVKNHITVLPRMRKKRSKKHDKNI